MLPPVLPQGEAPTKPKGRIGDEEMREEEDCFATRRVCEAGSPATDSAKMRVAATFKDGTPVFWDQPATSSSV